MICACSQGCEKMLKDVRGRIMRKWRLSGIHIRQGRINTARQYKRNVTYLRVVSDRHCLPDTQHLTSWFGEVSQPYDVNVQPNSTEVESEEGEKRKGRREGKEEKGEEEDEEEVQEEKRVKR